MLVYQRVDPLTAPCAKAASEMCWDADPYRSPDHRLGKDLSLGLHQSGLHPEILRLGNSGILTAELHQFSRGMSYDIYGFNVH